MKWTERMQMTIFVKKEYSFDLNIGWIIFKEGLKKKWLKIILLMLYILNAASI